jgi:hypothetical protein
MPVDVLTIVDSAVKIGLGALISGVATYYVTRLKDTAESTREYSRRKWELIECAVDSADTYTLALGQLFATLDGLRREYPDAKTIAETGAQSALEKQDDALLDTVLQRNRGFSRLKIIGETKAAESLSTFHELEDEIRLCTIFNGELPSSEKLEEWYQRFREIREAFLGQLSKTVMRDIG